MSECSVERYSVEKVTSTMASASPVSIYPAAGWRSTVPAASHMRAQCLQLPHPLITHRALCCCGPLPVTRSTSAPST